MLSRPKFHVPSIWPNLGLLLIEENADLAGIVVEPLQFDDHADMSNQAKTQLNIGRLQFDFAGYYADMSRQSRLP